MSNFILEKEDELKSRHYLLLANQVTHWFNASPNVVNKYRAEFGDDFCAVLWRDGAKDDAYVIPFNRLSSVLTAQNLVGGTGGYRRWHGGIKDGRLSLRDCDESIYVADCHNAFQLLGRKTSRQSAP
jgi:hypothetical protein